MAAYPSCWSLALLIALAVQAWAVPNTPLATIKSPEEVPDECKPTPPEPGKEVEICCDLPKFQPPNEEKHKLMQECHAMLDEELIPPPPPPPGGENPQLPPNGDHRPPPGGERTPPPPGGERPPPPPPHHGGPHPNPPPPGHAECMKECEFNKTGLLTPEMKFNEEVIMKKFMEEYGKEDSWKPVVEQAIKTCLTSSEDVKEDSKCKSGSHQLMMCFRRQLFLNCPNGIWKSSNSCDAEKEKVKKCKQYVPHHPPPPPPPPTTPSSEQTTKQPSKA